ncbi:MAG TPA: ankyrin repeat domain-containing protein [Longimicrobiales bacterium]|nr:ankyrin repeat domain-containing protein [Longimicrobiales bacterium]
MTTPEAFGEAVKEGRDDDVARMLDEEPGLASEPVDGLPPVLLAIFHRRERTAALLGERAGALGLSEAAALGSVEALRAAEARLSPPDGATDEILSRPGPLGWTPLHLAAFFGQPEATAWLLEKGADTKARSRNAEANTPLHAALAGANDSVVIGLLLEAGADPNAGAAQGVTPLHLAASRGNGEVVDLLLARGARAAAMEDGRLPSALADERGHPDLVARLASLEAVG